MKDFIFIEEVESTMTAMECSLEEQRLNDLSVLSTSFQRAGQGQEGNSWESKKGENLLFTLYLQPGFIKPSRQFLISKIVSLALYETVLHFLPGAEVKIKWPNDIYLGDRKLAGILIRHQLKGEEIQHSLAGIGLNVNQLEFSPDLPNPVSMKMEGGEMFDLKRVLEVFRISMKLFYFLLKDENHGEIDVLYHQRLYQVGETAEYILSGRKTRACILGVDEFGRLLLKEGEQINTCDLKEVVYKA